MWYLFETVHQIQLGFDSLTAAPEELAARTGSVLAKLPLPVPPMLEEALGYAG